MVRSRPFVRRAVLAVIFAATLAASAAAQQRARVRVTTDRATIWRPNFTTMITLVPAGTVLDVVARRGDWYEVIVPNADGATGATGMVAISQVVLMPGSPIPAEVGQPAAESAQAPPEPTAAPEYGVRGFGTFGYDWMAAHKAFRAVLGQSGGLLFGAGGQFRWKNQWIFEGSVERFGRTGERVFVSDNGDVFKLGIPDKITIVPIAFTAAYRFGRGDRAPYAGGGAGRYSYKEQSNFADPSENVDQHFSSYHVRGGYEWQSGLLATDFEIQYTHVPNALNGGAAAAFGEHNLGGVQARIRILVGK